MRFMRFMRHRGISTKGAYDVWLGSGLRLQLPGEAGFFSTVCGQLTYSPFFLFIEHREGFRLRF